jgi:hypothetical protein
MNAFQQKYKKLGLPVNYLLPCLPMSIYFSFFLLYMYEYTYFPSRKYTTPHKLSGTAYSLHTIYPNLFVGKVIKTLLSNQAGRWGRLLACSEQLPVGLGQMLQAELLSGLAHWSCGGPSTSSQLAKILGMMLCLLKLLHS